MFNKKKNNENVNWQYVYTIYDKVAKVYNKLFYANTDEEMIRLHLPSVLYKYPLRDIEIHRIGRFETNSGKFDTLTSKVIKLDKYTFPHSRLSSVGDDLPLDKLEEGIQNMKNEQLEKADIENKKTEETNSSSEVVNE